jgi:hypothetical protein
MQRLIRLLALIIIAFATNLRAQGFYAADTARFKCAVGKTVTEPVTLFSDGPTDINLMQELTGPDARYFTVHEEKCLAFFQPTVDIRSRLRSVVLATDNISRH